MSILKIKDSQGDWVEVQSIKGKKGDPFTYADFTTEQLESLKGKDGISPTVSVASDTSDDYRLSFTDETHTVTTPNLIPEAEKIFDVYPHDTASGAVASFPDGADGIPLKSCIVQVEPVQEGSGDPSPDNVRPITGWTEVDVEQRGKNLANLSFSDKVPSIYTGEMVSNAGWSTDFIRVFQNCDYIASFQTQHTNYVLFYDANKSYLGYTNSFSGVYSPNSNAYWSQTAYVKLCVDGTENESTKAQLELGSTATDYEPYQGETYPITFPTEAGTVYGGYVDVINGELVVDRASVDMGSLVWNYNTTYAFFTSNSISTRKIGVLNVWSDLFKTMAGSWSGTPLQNALWGNGSNTTLYVQIPPLDNVDDFMALVDGHQLMYELATPIHYPLTPTEIKTLLGQNNLWADTGDTEVEYRASTKMYIDRKITEAVASALNS